MAKPAEVSPPMLARIVHGRWVGRVREMADAISIWQHAASGEGRVLFLHGEPGVGKTRFAQELAKTAVTAGARVLSGECFAVGSAPYAPIIQLVHEGLDSPGFPGSSIPEEILSDLWTLSPSRRVPTSSSYSDRILDPEAAQQRVFESFVDFCSALCAQAPLLVFVDDVHWADTATLFLLRYLARRGRKLSLLIVMTYREAELEGAPALNQMLIDLNRERLAVELRLPRLSRDETSDLLAAMFAEEITSEFLDGIYTQTEGNPFFIEEMCKSLIDSGELFYQEGGWRRPAMTEMKLPQTVRSAIQDRLQKLSAPAQEMLRMAAMLGSEFDFTTLKSATELDEETLINALESAVRAQLITEVQTNPPAAPRFAFVHVLIPNTIRESMIRVRRRQFHQRAARAIEVVRPDDFEALAYHYAEAGENEPARGYFARAGIRAQPVAPSEAARFFRAALDRWPDEDRAGRADLLDHLGYCLWVLGDTEGSQQCYESAYHLFNELGDRTRSGEMQRMIGRIYWERADRESALRHYHQALRILEQGPDTPELAGAISSISQMYMLAHEDEQGILWGKRALVLAKRLGAERVVVHALNNIGSSYTQRGNFETGLRILQESLQHALAAGLTEDTCRAYYNLGVELQRQCRYHDATDQFAQLSAYAAQVYAKTYANSALCRLMWMNWWTGQWNDALAYRDRIVESSNTVHAIWTKRTCGMIDLDLGRIESARDELEQSLPGALRANEIQTTIPHLAQLVRVYDALGLDTKTSEVIDQILDILSDKHILSIESTVPLSIACQWLAAHRLPEAREKVHSCLTHLEQLAHQYPVGEPAAALQEARGSMLMAEKHLLEAAECFRLAAAQWGAIDRRYDQAHALASLGGVYAGSEDADAAKAAYNQAGEIYNSLGAQLSSDFRSVFLDSSPVQAVHRYVQALLRGKQPRTPRREVNQLTERELEVLKLVARGLTNAQIGDRLVLSPLTVNAHLRSIFGKLNVTTRTAAVHCAVEQKLI